MFLIALVDLHLLGEESEDYRKTNETKLPMHILKHLSVEALVAPPLPCNNLQSWRF